MSEQPVPSESERQQQTGVTVETPADSGLTHLTHGETVPPETDHVDRLMQHTIDLPELAEAVERQEPADAADTLERLEHDDAADILEQMEDQRAAEALAEMQTPLAIDVLEEEAEEDPKYAARLLELMAPDDAADLLQAIGEEPRHAILEVMHARPAVKLVELAAYDEESAGGMMTTDFLALREEMTVAEATDYIRSSDIPRTTNYALITDEQVHLVGVLNLRDLLLARSHQKLGDLMTREIKAVHPDMDREHVAHEFDRYDFEMMPVVDIEHHLLGVVTVDDIIDILRAEQTEDVQMTVGAGKGEAVYSGLREKFRGRFPWLGASLVMTCAAAFVVLWFEDLIRTRPILAFLLPVVAALVGNAGHQALAVTLRGIVLGEVRRERVWPLLGREVIVGLINGTALGVMMCAGIALLSLFIDDASVMVGVIAGIATLVAMSVGTLAGSGIPLLMRRFGFDPAQASAIFLIMITDAVSFSVLLTMARLLVNGAG